jgi:hypothetical protein
MESTCLKGVEKVLFFLGETGPLKTREQSSRAVESEILSRETLVSRAVESEILSEDNSSYIHLENVGNDYLSAADKQFLGIKYAHDHYDYNYLFVCGTDTYIVVPRLIKYLENLSRNGDRNTAINVPCIIGGHGDTRNICGKTVNYLAGGAGLILNKKLVESIYTRLTSLQEEWLSLCINNGYLQWIPSCDLALCWFLTLQCQYFHYATGLMYGCNYKGYNNTPNGLYPCCTTQVNPDKIISCHNMSPQDFDAFYKYLQQ